jgi:methionyl-tRNA synthetase
MESKLEQMVSKNKAKTKRRLVTAALPYVNNIPHLGHIVGSHLPADIFARFSRSKGYGTLFIGGSDENGTPCELAAEEIGVPIKKFLDKLYLEHKKIYDWFNISYDNFSRTSRKIHHETVKDFFKRLKDKGFIKEGEMDVFYSPKDKRYLPDRYILGECPKCGYKDANGDQCEKCTALLNPSELKNPRSSISGGDLEIRKSKHLFLDLKKLTPELKKWVDKQTFWRQSVKGIAQGWIKEGLRERCITRDLKQGVPVPEEGFRDKVFYVWFDAPIGYVSSTKEFTENWENFWKKDADIYNFLGKDNIPFHTIFWPAMVIGHGDFNLPKNVIGLQYLNYEGKKFSKSNKTGVFCEKLPELDLPADMWRSYLTQIIPETADTEFRWKDFQRRINSDLIGNYGNYVNRIIKFIEKKLKGKIIKPRQDKLTREDKKLLNQIKAYKQKIEDSLENNQIRKAYSEVFELSTLGNKYIHDTEPWVKIKTDKERVNDIYYNGARLLKAVTTYIAPFLPDTAEKVWKQLNLEGSPLSSGAWDSSTEDFGKEHSIGEPKILFQKIKDENIGRYKEIVSNPSSLINLF